MNLTKQQLEQAKEPCEECKGTGRHPIIDVETDKEVNSWECSFCQGTGYKPFEIEIEWVECDCSYCRNMPTKDKLPKHKVGEVIEQEIIKKHYSEYLKREVDVYDKIKLKIISTNKQKQMVVML